VHKITILNRIPTCVNHARLAALGAANLQQLRVLFALFAILVTHMCMGSASKWKDA
jgi:hypothetical protein